MAFNLTELIPGITHDNSHVATAAIATGTILFFSLIGRVALGTGEAAIMPAGKISFKGIFETVITFIRGLCKTVMGSESVSMAPLFGALFFFLFFNNLVGLLPGMTPATENINTGVAVGVFSFIIYNLFGFKEHGVAYLKQFLGPVLWLAPLMLPIELISHMVRPVSLGLRLQGNMLGDHMVLGIFTELLPVPGAVIFYFLGFFVSFMQAFVFTMLSMIYVSMSTSHDH
jgi:F-type H+-transporting ATPase subunit a